MRSCFKIVGPSLIPDRKPYRYRGVYRSLPSYVDDASPNSDVNRAFARFCEQGGQSGCLDDLRDVKAIASAYSGVPSCQDFDIIQIAEPNEELNARSSRSLGFDVAVDGTGYSLLSWDLQLSRFENADNWVPKIGPLISLTERYFSSRLNESGLFGSFDDADFFLRCMTALQEMHPALWESYGMNAYKIVAVHLIDGGQAGPDC